VFLIDTKFDGHYLYFDSNLSSHIALNASKGNLVRYLIAHTLCLRKEMQPMNNNVMSISSLNIFNFKFC
jgi:hypothetical protein